MGWQVFLTISILAESSGRILQRVLMKDGDSDPIAYSVWFQFLAGCILLIYTLIVGFKLPNNLLSIAPNLILEPIFWGMTIMLIFKALTQTEASIFTILFGTRVIFIVLTAVILLKETFSTSQMLGTILIILSVILVSYRKEKWQFKKGELYSLLAGIFATAGVINDAVILKQFDVTTYSALGFLGPGLFIWATHPTSTKKIVALPKSKIFPKLALLGSIYGIAYLTYNSAYFSSNNAAQIAAIFQVSSVITVLLAIILLKEKSKLLLKLLAATVGFIGVLLVS